METNNREIRDLLTKYEGVTKRLNTIFAYHYDQIKREIEHEIRNLHIPEEEQYLLLDHFAEFMEESMNWPSNGTNNQFISSSFL